MTTHRSYVDFLGTLEGKSVIVCGCGPSVTQLKNPEAAITIGVNDIGRLFTPDYLLVINSVESFKDGRGAFVKNSTCKTIFSQYENLSVDQKKSLVKINFGKRGELDIDNLEELAFSNNSPFVGVVIAYHMGAKHIGLLGVDFTEHHFFKETGVHRLNKSLTKINNDYRKLTEALTQKGVELYNLSPGSSVKPIPKLSLETFMAQADFSRSVI